MLLAGLLMAAIQAGLDPTANVVITACDAVCGQRRLGPALPIAGAMPAWRHRARDLPAGKAALVTAERND